MPEYRRDLEPLDYRFMYMERMPFLMRTMLLAMLVMAGLLVLVQVTKIVPSIQRMLDAQADMVAAQAAGLKVIPDLEAKIADLDKRTKTLTSQEIDSRLTRIETAIRVGQVSPSQLASLQQLRQDFDSLKTFMFARPEQLVEFRTLQRDYLELKEASKNIMPRQDMLRELESTKTLFYWNLAVFGVLASIFAGAWFMALRQTMKLKGQMSQPGQGPGTSPAKE